MSNRFLAFVRNLQLLIRVWFPKVIKKLVYVVKLIEWTFVESPALFYCIWFSTKHLVDYIIEFSIEVFLRSHFLGLSLELNLLFLLLIRDWIVGDCFFLITFLAHISRSRLLFQLVLFFLLFAIEKSIFLRGTLTLLTLEGEYICLALLKIWI